MCCLERRVTCTPAVRSPAWPVPSHDFPAHGSHARLFLVVIMLWVSSSCSVRVRTLDDVKLDVGVTVLFASFSGKCLMWFEDDNEVLQATTLPPVSLSAERVEACLSIM